MKKVLFGCTVVAAIAALTQPAQPQTKSPDQALIDRYCVTCHNQKAKTAGLLLDTMD